MNRFFNLVTALVLICSGASAGNPPETSEDHTQDLMRFAGNIHQFNSIYPQEKVYLQFDNTSYYSGETIWFKAFVVNASLMKHAPSKVLYVDLISPTGVLLNQQKLKIVAGQADGSFPLTDAATGQAREKRGEINYPSGFYEVRAYTSYMQNFSEDIIFSRVFAVYDKPQKEGNYYGESPTINTRKPDTWVPRPKTEKLRTINCAFYPEGGHLIIGKPCRVAFKVTDESGLGIDAEGTLDNSDITFSTIHDGMGWFTFTPSNRRSSVTITVDRKSHSFSLPQTETEGCSLSADLCDTDSLHLRIDYTQGLSGIRLGMTMTCRGELIGFDTFDTEDGPITKTISMKSLPEGVCRINIFDSDGNIYASRSVYHNNELFKTPVLEVIPDKERYEPFEKVALKFSLIDKNGNPFRDRFCLSVRDVRGLGNTLADDLRTSMLLSSDLKGFIENPSWYFDSDAPERKLALDLLMLVQGWERYDWLTMTGQKDFSETHRLEESLTMNGWIINSSGKKKMEGIEVTATLVPQDKTQTETYTYITDSTGYFGFDIGTEFYDKARFTIAAHAKKRLVGPAARIKFDRSLLPSIRAYLPQELVFRSLNGMSKEPGRKEEGENDNDDLPMLINTDLGVLLPDVDIDEQRMYVDYWTFNAFDVVKDVEIEMDQGEYSTDLLGYLSEKGYWVYIQEPDCVMINGFPSFFYIHDENRYLNMGIYEVPHFLALDTKDIKSILVYDPPIYRIDTYTLAPLWVDKTGASPSDHLGPGTDVFRVLYERIYMADVLIKERRDISTRDEIFNINKRTTTVEGYSRQYSFYSPDYPDGPVIGDVDYRRTLYWNPNVITDENGSAQVEFYNNSITRHFNISAAGITASGIPYILNQDW